MGYILCYGYINNPKILVCIKPSHVYIHAFRKVRDEKHLAIAMAVWELGASKPIGAIGFSDFFQ